MRGFTILNKQLFWGNSLFNKSRAYVLIFNMFYTKQYFWIELFLEVTTQKKYFYKRSRWLFVTGGIQLTALLIHSYGIRKRRLSVVQLKSNQITFIVTSPQHKCLGEWNSYERAPDSAKKQNKKKNNNLHIDSTYLQTVQKTMCKIHIHILSTHSVL